MSKAILGIDNSNLESDLKGMIQEIPGLELEATAPTSSQLREYADRFEPELIFVHEKLGPDPALSLVSELSISHPASAVILLSSERSPSTVIAALEKGAKNVIAYPFAYEDFNGRVNSALDWSRQMHQVINGATQAAQNSRGKIMALAGAKGGVGTTTLAIHLAISYATDNPGLRVCVVDLDIEKGDVSSVLDVRQNVSIANLSVVYRDLSASTVKDAVVEHESGIYLLLAPNDVRASEDVTPEALRTILSLLRQVFNVVIVDAGGYVSPAQATALEVADSTLVVTTGDVLAIRTMKKRMAAWENLGVVGERELKVLVNKVDRGSSFPVESVEKLTTARVLEENIPLTSRTIEPALVSRDPRTIQDENWWKIIRKIREAVLPVNPQTTEATYTPADSPESVQAPTLALNSPFTPASSPRIPARRKKTRKRFGLGSRHKSGGKPDGKSGETGAISLEFVGVFAILLIVLWIVWQGITAGVSYFWLAQATTESARAYAVSGGNLEEAQTAAEDTVPDGYASGITVSDTTPGLNPSEIQVKLTIDSNLSFINTFTTTRSVVMEGK